MSKGRPTYRELEGRVGELEKRVKEVKRADKALLESEERYRQMVAAVIAYTYSVEVKDGRAVSTHHSPGCKAVTGYSPENYKSDPYLWYSMIHPDDREMIRGHVARALDGEDVSPIEHRIILKDGSVLWVRDTLVLFRDTRGRLTRYDGLVENITERKQAEEDLQKSEEMARALLNATTDAVVLLDTKGVILDINDTYARQFHKSTDEMLSLCIWDMFPAEVTKPRKANAKQVFKSGKPVRMRDEVHGRRNDIIIYPVCDLKGKVTRVAFFLRDITKELELEEQLRHSQKMETVGLLAGGVAHDFNNMLTPILGYADMALLSLREGDPLYKDIKGIREAAERASALTSQLLAFSRKQVLNLKEVCINKAVTGFNKMLHRIIGEDIELVTALEPSLWKVKADIDQIQQILMNLAVNARDAMSGGGKLTIETENVCLDDEFARIHSDVESGPHVMLSLSDNGRGIDDETMGHIFEPFFTTKELGKGTGLGLSTVYGIVKQHGGSIWVSSKPDLGTAFKIYFPRAEGAAEPATEASDHLRVSPGSETVLVVEDEEMVRKLACDVLSSHGYKTIPARDAVEALQLVKRLNGSVDLLLTDVIMPGINGRELYRRLTAKRSDLKVLYMSGYTHDIIAGHGVLDPGINFIHKPFSLKSLLLKVRETLEN